MRISDWSSDVCSSDLDRNVRSGRRGILAGLLQDAARRAQAGRRRRDSGHHHQPEDLRRIPQQARLHPEVQFPGRIVEMGRASCRERVWQYVKISVFAETLTKKEQ